MYSKVCSLPRDCIEGQFAYFESLGLKPDLEIIDELLYEIGRAGLEHVNAIRYCKLGDKVEFEAFKNIEKIGVGTIWEHQSKKDNDIYLLACHYK